ncbi:hypothetical protein IGI04_038053 [Brassica rapa subsp. trilocularis]|uniref:Response regulatory domain-containing protein n=2 Tax=Brassica campestris TaxID=3711 RepID=M4FIU8_BRACM|nr:putative two-component response regulator ARR20 isoform X2 [Brassica rapa]XP_013639954.2 putative two-component response regulator ARR20 isoform X2 [Brassica napus]KAG5386583.1 hypothetical protein IGI04_038053 [Brassica rapa subsp. trilocularis]
MSVSSNILKENSRDLLREEEPGDDEVEFPINDEDEDFSITSIRIVLVDSDPESLCLMKNLMTQYSYQVRDFKNGAEAIAFLMMSKHEIDLVIWDFHVPEINGLEALKTIGKEMDLPVVIMSHEHKKKTVMESTKRGSCNFLLKPVSKEIIAVLWQHVYRKRVSIYSVESNPEENVGLDQDDIDLYQTNSNSGEQTSSYQKEGKNKKPRMTWTPELHQLFEKAVEKMGGVEQAVPKQILKCMQEEKDAEGLTRNNVASHLQKYRLNSGKKSSMIQETREDSEWRNAGPNTALTASKPLPNSIFGLHTRVPYFANDQDARNGPMQYPSTNYFTMDNGHFMTNSFANLPYTDSFHQQQQQQFQHQQYSNSSLQLPSVITKQEFPYVSAALENPDLIANENSLYMDLGDYLQEGLSDFDKTNRY